MMEETNVSVQIYRFLKVTAVCYEEKPIKDGQRYDFFDIVIRNEPVCLTVGLNQPAGGMIDCMIHVPKICQISLESQYSLYSETLKHLKTKSANQDANTSSNYVVSC